MGAPISVRRRLVSGQSVRLSQPLFWGDGFSARFLTGTTANVLVTASATTHTPGSWAELRSDTATTETTGLLLIAATSTTATSTDTGLLIDIGTGASGSEVVRVPSLAISQHTGIQTAIPIRIPGSTRVAVRLQSSVASRTANIQATLFATPFPDRLPLSVDVLGTSTATSVGTAMSGASGTWVEITSSTTKDYQALVLVPSASDTGATLTVRYDLGIGASGSEIEVGATSFAYNTNANVGNVGGAAPVIQPGIGSVYGAFVPAGTRISVRHNIASTPGRCDACVIGVPYV